LSAKNIEILIIYDEENIESLYFISIIESNMDFHIKKIHFENAEYINFICLPEFHIFKNDKLIGKIYGYDNFLDFKRFFDGITV